MKKQILALLYIFGSCFSISVQSAERKERNLSPLEYAALKADREKVFSILNSENFTKDNQGVPLHIVCGRENKIPIRIEIIKKLMAHGYEPYDQDNSGTTPLNMACSKGVTPFVQMLTAEKPLRLNLESGRNPLHITLERKLAFKKKYDISEILLEKADENEMCLTHIVNERGNIPLQEALYILQNHPNCPERFKYSLIDLMLQHTPSEFLDSINYEGKTYLHLLVDALRIRSLGSGSAASLIEKGLEKGANPWIQDPTGYTPACYISFIQPHSLESARYLGAMYTMLRYVPSSHLSTQDQMYS